MAAAVKQVGGRAFSYLTVRRGRPPAFMEAATAQLDVMPTHEACAKATIPARMVTEKGRFPSPPRGFMRPAVGILIALSATFLIAAEIPAQSRAGNISDLDTLHFAVALGVSLAGAHLTPSGARWRELSPGTGAASGAEYVATIRLSMFTVDGRVVGRDSVVTFTVPVGAGELMPGMDEALVGMRVGARRQVVLPRSAQGMAGEDGMPGVPVGGAVVVNVELLEIGTPLRSYDDREGSTHVPNTRVRATERSLAAIGSPAA